VIVEKRKPHHDLGAFKKEAWSPDELRATRTAIHDAGRIGFSKAGMVEVIQSMKRVHFYKSMTSNQDSTQWQDVYHVPWEDMLLYVKFTKDRLTEFLLLSFKER